MSSPFRSPQQAPASGPEALNAPLFASLVERLEGGERCVVLDLGAARTETLALFGQFRARMNIADIGDGIERFETEMDPEALRDEVERLLPSRTGEPADVVLCWDLLNYLPRPALAAVMCAVADRVRPGALAHALIVYSSQTMSERPGCFVPLDAQRLINVAPNQAQRSAPRYSSEDLAHCMPNYSVERARLLRNGMQEFLFRI